jgi:hypothetical protein
MPGPVALFWSDRWGYFQGRADDEGVADAINGPGRRSQPVTRQVYRRNRVEFLLGLTKLQPEKDSI